MPTIQGLQPLHWSIIVVEFADVGKILASGKEKWYDLVVVPLVASKDSVIAWLDTVTKASDASQKATEDEEAIPDNIDQGRYNTIGM